MSLILETFDKVVAQGWHADWENPDVRAFLLAGDEKFLKKIAKFKKTTWVPQELIRALPLAGDFDDIGRRLLRVCLAAETLEAFGLWIQRCSERDNPAGDAFAAASRIALECGCPKPVLNAQVAQWVQPLQTDAGAPTPSGAFLLGLSDREIRELVGEATATHCGPLTRLFVAHAPDRWRRCLESLRNDDIARFRDLSPWLLPLESAPEEFLEQGARAFQLQRDWDLRFQLGARLSELEPERFGPVIEEIARKQLLAKDTASGGSWHQAFTAACWLVAKRGTVALSPLRDYFAAGIELKGWDRKGQSEYKNRVLELAFQKLGREALPLAEACFAPDQPEVQLMALQLWAAMRSMATGKSRRPNPAALCLRRIAGRGARGAVDG